MKLKELVNNPSLVLEARTIYDVYFGTKSSNPEYYNDPEAIEYQKRSLNSYAIRAKCERLTSLYGCPEVTNEEFDCHDNRLRTLEFCPKVVKGFFDCSKNRLTMLEHGPLEVHGQYDCSNNHLTSLLGIPKAFSGALICKSTFITDLRDLKGVTGLTVIECSNNDLTSLQGIPAYLTRLDCSQNDLTSLEGLHTVKHLDCANNELTSLKGIHHHIKNSYWISFSGNPIRSHVLGLMKIEGLRTVFLGMNKLEKISQIINRHLQENENGSNLEACADELCENNFEDYAQL